MINQAYLTFNVIETSLTAKRFLLLSFDQKNLEVTAFEHVHWKKATTVEWLHS